MRNTGNIALQNDFSDVERQVWEFKDDLSICGWVESRRYLGARSEEKGQMRLERTPYMRPWLEAAIDPEIEEIILMKSAQVAGTEFALSVAGYYADIKAAPVLMTLADEKTAVYMARDRLKKVFEDSPDLEYLILGAAVCNSEEFELANGAYIGVAWASSVAGLATKPFKVVIGDEIDKPGYYTKTKEASPISLMRERNESFFEFKRIFLSTPTLDIGNVTLELESCDVIYDWHVPCPYCGVKQPLRFSHDHAEGFQKGFYRGEDGRRRKLGRVVWKGGSKATKKQIANAQYECGSCKKTWTTGMKNRAVGLGITVPRTKPKGKSKKIGFHINRIYSLLGKSGHLDRLVDAFISAKTKSDPRVLQGFINSALAEPWRPVMKTRKKNRILELADDRPRGTVPGGGVVSCLLGGVDTQDDGFYYEIRAFGYGKNLESWCIREGFVLSLDELAEIMWNSDYRDIDDNQYHVGLVCQDAMGHRTSEVYSFCANHRGRIFPTQGKDTLTQPFRYSDIEYFPRTKKPIPGGIKLVRFDTNFFKSELHQRLEVCPGDPGCWHYHSEIMEDWAEQMTVEGIGISGKWENPGGKPNHAWDVSVLLLLTAKIYGVEYIKPGGKKNAKEKVESKKWKEKKEFERPKWLRT